MAALPHEQQVILKILGRVRAASIEALFKYPGLEAVTPDTLRKRCDRLVEKGLLGKSAIPGSTQIYRLSKKGVQLVGAPASYAEPLTAATAYDSVAASHCGWEKDRFVFLTRQEWLALGSELSPGFAMERQQGRFLLRRVSVDPPETHYLHFWLAEFKPADQLARRIHAISSALTKANPLFPELIQRDLFGVSVAVPTQGVADTLLNHQPFPVPVVPIVVPELAPLALAPLAEKSPT